jgi:hypothetical protein
MGYGVRKILKSKVLKAGRNELDISYLVILDALMHHDGVFLYTVVDEETSPKKLIVYMIGTNWDVDLIVDNGLKNIKFLRTVSDGLNVWHVFYEED